MKKRFFHEIKIYHNYSKKNKIVIFGNLDDFK